MKAGILALVLVVLVSMAGMTGCTGAATTTGQTSATTLPTTTTPPTIPPTTTETTTTEPTPTTPPSTTVTTGSLEVHSNAWSADVLINGELKGQIGAGVTTIGGLLPGTYTVKLTSSLKDDGSKQAVIEAGKKTVLYVYLATKGNGTPGRSEIITPDAAALYGSLELHSNAWSADTYVGGESGGQIGAGVTTIGGLLPGTYTVNLISNVYDGGNKQVSIETGRTTVVYVYLATEGNGTPGRSEIITPDSAALFGSLELHSNAWNADIYLDGESGGQIGAGVAMVYGLLPGTYTIKLTSPVYRDWQGQVTVSTGQITVVNADMILK